VTENIYNADPQQPGYNQYFSISRTTGTMKACAGKSSREECGCTEYQKYSSDPRDSDCNERVITTYFDRSFWPHVAILRKGEPAGLLKTRYSIREINGRTDWCVNSKSDAWKIF
jgi:cation channel sperm-associated protein subunit beta